MDEEMTDVEVWEFTLDDGEIDELVEKLQKLKKTKKNFSFDIDDENELCIRHVEDETEEETE